MTGHTPWRELVHKRDARAVDELFDVLRDQWPRTFDRICVRTKRMFDNVPCREPRARFAGGLISEGLTGVAVFEDHELPVGRIELRRGEDVVQVIDVPPPDVAV